MTWHVLLTHLLFAGCLTALSAGISWMMLRRARIIDIPNERSSHARPVPKCGGISIVAVFFIGVLSIYWMGDGSQIGQGYFLGFILSAFTVASISYADDVNSRPIHVRLVIQLVASLIVVSFGLTLETVMLPFLGAVELGWLGYAITIVWIVGLTNAYNFMDGLDGLAAGVAVIVAVFFMFITWQQGSLFVYINSYAILAGALGFLFFNVSPARIFMGDVGSAFLGFVFATLAIIAARYDVSHTSLLVMPLLLFNFIYDTAFTFFRRLLAGDRVTHAHRTHLYQLCNRLGLSHRAVSMTQYGMCVVQGFAAIWMASLPREDRWLVFVPFVICYGIYSWVVVSKAKRRGLV